MAQNIDLSNLEELLMNSSPDQIQELQQYLFDDTITNSYKCDKKPTGPLNMENLRKHMETTAKNEEDWPELVPHTKKTVNKKPNTSTQLPQDDFSSLDDTIRQALEECDSEDFSVLAGMLGVHGLNTQKDTCFKSPKPKIFQEESANSIDVEDSIEKVRLNSPEMKELNLNNIHDISDDEFYKLFNALKSNQNLQSLSMSSTKFSNKFSRALSEALESNTTLVKLNLSSNFLTGSSILEIMEAVNKNCTLKELRLTNQSPMTLGWKTENGLVDLVMKNNTLKVLSADLSTPTARFSIQKKLQGNSFRSRKTK